MMALAGQQGIWNHKESSHFVGPSLWCFPSSMGPSLLYLPQWRNWQTPGT